MEVLYDVKLQSSTMKSLKMRLFTSLYTSHCTETLQWHCYNNVVIVFLAVITMLSMNLLCVIAALL